MPNINQGAISVGVIAVSIAVAAGIALYESPELRRIAENFRRRIAVALYSLGDSISPAQRDDLLSHPEDAEGFLLSRGIDVRNEEIGDGVDADEESRRRQREELMYWNARAASRRRRESGCQEKRSGSVSSSRKSSSPASHFDDFLRQDATGEKGTFVVQTGADVRPEVEGLRRRGENGRVINGFANGSAYGNPFTDEHGIDETVALENSLMEPEKDEMEEDIYSVSHYGREVKEEEEKEEEEKEEEEKEETPQMANSTLPTRAPILVEFESPIQHIDPEPIPEIVPELTGMSSIANQSTSDGFATAGSIDRTEGVYSSIHAWAETSNPSFYSPLPVSPPAPLSEPEIISEGAMTPTDSTSLAGSGVHIDNDVADDVRSMTFDVLSEDDLGMATPASWSELGSVISEEDAAAPR